jgi:hypothetical protein
VVGQSPKRQAKGSFGQCQQMVTGQDKGAGIFNRHEGKQDPKTECLGGGKLGTVPGKPVE